jgi:FkbM family methyltransferase
MLQRFSTPARAVVGLVRRLGLRGALDFRRECRRQTTIGRGQIHMQGMNAPMVLRRGSSDLEVFRQIFIDKEYEPLLPMMKASEVGLVIDCGANVGYSSSYFLRRFPTCRVVAIEPDDANFEMLQLNVAQFGTRCSTIRAGVWSHNCSLALRPSPYRDGREWSHQVEQVADGTPGSLPALDLNSILSLAGGGRVSLLKMDVEGSEVPIFSAAPIEWLQWVDAIAIELHDDTVFGPATPVFEKALDEQFSLSHSGELTLATRKATSS